MKTEDTFHLFTFVLTYVRDIILLSTFTGLKTSSLLCRSELTCNIIHHFFFIARPGCLKTHFSSASPLKNILLLCRPGPLEKSPLICWPVWKIASHLPAHWKNHLLSAGLGRAAYGPQSRLGPVQTSNRYTQK